jgi:hypothetical protein
MDLIPPAEFARLRLADLLPPGQRPDLLTDFEYEEDLWVGESVGFTEWLRLEEDPDVLRSVALDLADLPAEVSARALDALRLSLAPGMTLQEVVARLGAPGGERQFLPHSRNYEFRCGPDGVYSVSCTVDEEQGLIYVTVMTPTPRRLAVAEEDHSVSNRDDG